MEYLEHFLVRYLTLHLILQEQCLMHLKLWVYIHAALKHQRNINGKKEEEIEALPEEEEMVLWKSCREGVEK